MTQAMHNLLINVANNVTTKQHIISAQADIDKLPRLLHKMLIKSALIQNSKMAGSVLEYHQEKYARYQAKYEQTLRSIEFMSDMLDRFGSYENISRVFLIGLVHSRR